MDNKTFNHTFDFEVSKSIFEFFNAGGPVLIALVIVLLIFWIVYFERLIYMLFSFPQQQKRWVSKWRNRTERSSWFARKQRDAMLSESHLALERHLNLLNLFTRLFPMLGLLGSVFGMLNIFELIELFGAGDSKAMASGISQATLPTLAGMACALMAMFASAQLRFLSQNRQLHFERLLQLV